MIKYLKNYCIILICILSTACFSSEEQARVKETVYIIDDDSLDLAREYDSSLCSQQPTGRVAYTTDGVLWEITITGYNCRPGIPFSRHRDSFTYNFWNPSGEDGQCSIVIYDSMYFDYKQVKDLSTTFGGYGNREYFPIIMQLNFFKPVEVRYNPNLSYNAEKKFYSSGAREFGYNEIYYYKYSKGDDHYFSYLTSIGEEKKLHLNFKIIKNLKEFLQMLKERDLYKYVEPQLRAKDKL